MEGFTDTKKYFTVFDTKNIESGVRNPGYKQSAMVVNRGFRSAEILILKQLYYAFGLGVRRT
jgi:hypothetical protein